MKKAIFFLIYFTSIISGVYAQDDFFIKDYFVDIKIKEDGSFRITEIIHVFFNYQRRGILRDIPLKYKVDHEVSGQWLDQFFPHELEISDVSVKNYKFDIEQEGNGVRIRIGDPEIYLEGDQTYEIKYTIENGFLHRKEFSEFYWNLIGDFWEQEIKQSGFKVSFPPSMKIDSSDVAVFSGSYGSRGQTIPVRINDNVVEGEAEESLGRRKGMTIAVKIPKGIIAEYPWYILLWNHLKFAILPLITLFGFWYTWWKYGRDSRLAKVVSYLPPKSIDSALAGYAIDLKVHQRDVFSLIPYFGSRGFLKMEQQSKDEIIFHKLQELPDDVPPHQKLFFDGLFGYGSSVRLSSLKNKFYTTLAEVASSVSDTAMHSDYFTPESVKVYKRSIFLLIFAGIINSIFCFLSGRIFFLILTVLIIIILIIINYILLKRSQRGDEIYQEVRGFKHFIKMAEKEKLNFLLKEDPQYFDKTLPFAVAFNLTEDWTDKFEGLTFEPPRWYTSYGPNYYAGGGFHAREFEKAMSSSLDEMRSVMSSQPSQNSSSWSGGSGGGGFSGGGFGGGGGSSW